MKSQVKFSCLLFLALVIGVGCRNAYTALYNKSVVKAEKMERPLSGWIGYWGIYHAGVRVTTRDGELWLVHKTKTKGSSDTVVTTARYMSSKWSVKQTKYVRGVTVGDYVAAGGTKYNLLVNNCWNAARRMMRLPY